MGCRGPE